MRFRIIPEELLKLKSMIDDSPDLVRQFNKAVIMAEECVEYSSREVEDSTLRSLLERVVDTMTHVFTTGTGGYSGSYRYGCYLRVKYDNGSAQDIPLVFTCSEFDLEHIKVEFYHQKLNKYLIIDHGTVNWFVDGVVNFIDNYCGVARNGEARSYKIQKFTDFFVNKDFYESKPHENYIFVDRK